MKEIVLKVTTDTSKSVKNLNQLENEINSLKDTIRSEDIGSDEFKRLSREIKGAESKLKNLNKSYEGLDFDAKAGELGKLAGGLGAVGTAAALVTAGNEDMEKFFKTFATGIAITQGVKGAIEATAAAQKLLAGNTFLAAVATKAQAAGTAVMTAVQGAYNAVLGATNIGLKAFKIALAATGIGLLVLGVAALIANFDAVKDAIMFVVNAIKESFQPAIDLVIKALQWLGLVESEEEKKAREVEEKRTKKLKEEAEDRARALRHLAEVEKRLTEEKIAGLDAEIRRRRANGQETAKIEREKIEVLIDSAKKQLDIRRQQAKFSNRIVTAVTGHELGSIEKLNTELEALALDLEVFNIEQHKKRRDRSKKTADEIKKNEEQLIKDLIAINERIAKVEDDFFLRNQSKLDQEVILRQQQFDAEFAAAEGNAELQKQLKEETLTDIAAIEQRFADDKATQDKEANDKKKEDDKADAADEVALARDVSNAKLNLTQQGLSTAMAITELFGKKTEAGAKRAFEVNKAFQIAQAIISTYQGANNAFASAAASPITIGFPAFPAISAGLAVAGGLANVAKIAQTKFKGTAPAAGGGGTTGGGRGGAGAPSPATLNQSTLFATGGTPEEVISSQTNGAQQVVKAVVVESDITSTVNNVNNIKETATL